MQLHPGFNSKPHSASLANKVLSIIDHHMDVSLMALHVLGSWEHLAAVRTEIGLPGFQFHVSLQMLDQSSLRREDLGTLPTWEFTDLFLVVLFACNRGFVSSSHPIQFLLSGLVSPHVARNTFRSFHWFLADFAQNCVLFMNAVEMSPEVVLGIVGLFANVTVPDSVRRNCDVTVSLVISQSVHGEGFPAC